MKFRCHPFLCFLSHKSSVLIPEVCDTFSCYHTIAQYIKYYYLIEHGYEAFSSMKNTAHL